MVLCAFQSSFTCFISGPWWDVIMAWHGGWRQKKSRENEKVIVQIEIRSSFIWDFLLVYELQLICYYNIDHHN